MFQTGPELATKTTNSNVLQVFAKMSKQKEVFNLANSLACIPSILLGKCAVIYMRNETWVAGKVTDYDGWVKTNFYWLYRWIYVKISFMNITLENLVFCDQKGLQYKLNNYFIRFRQILYIQIPESVSIFFFNSRACLQKFQSPLSVTQSEWEFFDRVKQIHQRVMLTTVETRNIN